MPKPSDVSLSDCLHRTPRGVSHSAGRSRIENGLRWINGWKRRRIRTSEARVHFSQRDQLRLSGHVTGTVFELKGCVGRDYANPLTSATS